MSDTYYPIMSLRSAVHVVRIDCKRALCGVYPERYWEMSFEGEPFPEISEFVVKHPHTNGEGFQVGRSFAGDYQFCPKCYSKLKSIFNK